jgi:hypothetical protein
LRAPYGAATEAAHSELLAKFRKTTLRCLQDMDGKQHQPVGLGGY